MAENVGKKFEAAIRQSFEKVPGVSIDRLHDQMNGFKGSQNICDFIVYKKPYEYYFECKSVHGTTLSIFGKDPKKKYGNITNTQWEGLVQKSKIEGVKAGIICWWVDYDQTWFIPIEVLQNARTVAGAKSINIRKPHMQGYWVPLCGKKKRVFFDYDMRSFLKGVNKWQ